MNEEGLMKKKFMHVLRTRYAFSFRGCTGVNLTNILRATIMHKDSKSEKNQITLMVFFALLGSVRTKATCKYIGEIDSKSP